MAVRYNFGVVESEQRQLSITKSPDDAYTEASGVRETVVYTGPWDEIVAIGRAAAANAAADVSVQVDADRSAGDVGEVRITTEKYGVSGSGAGGGDEEDPADDTLGTEDNPTYTMSSCLVQSCILAHPKFKNLTSLERRALKAMIDGQDENSMLDDESSSTGRVRIIDCLTGSLAQKAYDYISRGIFVWNDVSTEATARWRGGGNSYAPGTICETTPGGFPSGAGRNWLCSGAGKEKNGSDTWNSASFRLSGVGGWDSWLYDGSAS